MWSLVHDKRLQTRARAQTEKNIKHNFESCNIYIKSNLVSADVACWVSVIHTLAEALAPIWIHRLAGRRPVSYHRSLMKTKIKNELNVFKVSSIPFVASPNASPAVRTPLRPRRRFHRHSGVVVVSVGAGRDLFFFHILHLVEAQEMK